MGTAAREILTSTWGSGLRTVERLLRLVEDEQALRLRTSLADEIEGLYASHIGDEHVREVERRLLHPLRRQVVRRLLARTVGLLVGVTAYLYALTWILIPIGVSAAWLDAPTATTTVSLLLGEVKAPLGVYPAVACLLGIIATAVVLAFAMTEDRYAGDVTKAVLYEPIRDGLTLARPYEALRERSDHTRSA